MTQDKTTKTGTIMTNANRNNEEIVIEEQNIKELLEGIGERNRKDWMGIAVAYKNLGGEYEDFENHFLKMSLNKV